MAARQEKRHVWKVGEAWRWPGAGREAEAEELAREGVLRQQDDPDIFADLLAGTYVPTRAEIEARRERDAGPADEDGPDVARPAG